MDLKSPMTRAESLAEQIEDSIRTQGLAPGALVGKMDELRSQSGYARSTVSEAVRLLRDRGIIEIRPGRNGGLFVAESDPIVHVRHTLLRLREPAARVADAVVVRDALELQVNLDAAEHRTDDDLRDLDALVSRMGRHVDDFTSFMRANWALHERIAAISTNELLKAVYLATCAQVADVAAAELDDDAGERDEYIGSRLRIHEDLVASIGSQDPDAVYAAVLAHRDGGTTSSYLPPAG
ncbi:FCD domain-containing protein [Nocardioides flavescens]